MDSFYADKLAAGKLAGVKVVQFSGGAGDDWSGGGVGGAEDDAAAVTAPNAAAAAAPAAAPAAAAADQYQYLKNLMNLMRDGSTLINSLFQKYWKKFLKHDPIDITRYFHSGGNLFVILAGILCYLFENSYNYTYEPHILDKIRKEFNDILLAQGMLDAFYNDLDEKMKNPLFKKSLKDCTSQISDMDFVLMAPDEYVADLDNAILKKINTLSAYILRKILVLAHKDIGDPNPDVRISKRLLPFNYMFDKRWRQIRSFFNMSKITAQDKAMIMAVGRPDYYGYRQISNIVPEIPIYLNRLKQGYPFFLDKRISKNIPLKVHKEYYTKYGECLDLSIGVLTNRIYSHKHNNFKVNKYYSIPNLLEELNEILDRPTDEPRDDKTTKREDRRDFLLMINNNFLYDILFNIIGQNIT